MFTRTLSILAKNSLALLGKSGILSNAYLAGGSALALHLGHRYSIDFDFFSKTPLETRMIVDRLSSIGNFQVQMKKEHTLIGTFNNIKLSLFHYDYPLISKLHQYSNIAIADPSDIAAMKIVAIVDRGTKRDFVDLYFLAKSKYPFEQIFNFYERKYRLLANNLYTIITAIGYFDDADSSAMPRMIKKVSWKDVKRFFEKETIRLGKKYL